MKTHATSMLRASLVGATFVILALSGYGRASAAPVCDAVGKATLQSYEALWKYKALPPSEGRLRSALQELSKTFDDIGFDVHARLSGCADATALPFDMLAAYWYEEQAKIEAPSVQLLNAMTQRLRDLHDVLPADNIFFAQFLRDVLAAYKQSSVQIPQDVAAWAADLKTGTDADCRMPYYQEATIRSWAAPRYPVAARAAGFGRARTYVQVTIDANGYASDARLLSSSGNRDIDRISADAARTTLYYPTTLYCTPLTGTYKVWIIFDPERPTSAGVSPLRG